MKKVKQILAILGIVLLVSLYLVTLICAITDNSGTMQVFYASVVATIIIPVLLWAYSFIYRLIKKSNEPDESENNEGTDIIEEDDISKHSGNDRDKKTVDI